MTYRKKGRERNTANAACPLLAFKPCQIISPERYLLRGVAGMFLLLFSWNSQQGRLLGSEM